MSLSNKTFDAAIIGAGPAGGVAAALLAERGYQVLLIEKSTWPREKVCGGCLTSAASTILRQVGIAAPLQNAQRIHHAVWHARKREMRVETPGELAVARSDLDARIVAEAQKRGAEFASGYSASLLRPTSDETYRTLRLQRGTEQTEIRAAVVLAADGISGTSLANEPWSEWTIDPHAWIGVAATCPPDAFDLPPGEIHMHIGNSGYVGLVRMNEEHIHMAAALDPAVCKSAGGPIPLMRRILESSLAFSPSLGIRFPPSPGTPGEGRGGGGISIDSRRASTRGPSSSTNNNHLFDWESLRIRGTASLTRHRKQLGGHRVLAIGDACGYVEPFTGEGIAWAVASAREAVRLLPAPGESWPSDLPARWQKQHFRLIAGKQRWCRGMRPMMRHPEFAPVIMTVANAVPTITRWIATRISQPRRCAATLSPSSPSPCTQGEGRGEGSSFEGASA